MSFYFKHILTYSLVWREGSCYEIECKRCDGEEGGVKTKYIGETSRSTMERLKEHLWLFTHKKEGDPTKDEASPVLRIHSRDSHEGAMTEEDWRSKVVSTHFGALNRQVTEAVKISGGGGGGGGVRLLNNKQEFGANLLLEVVVMRGDQVLGTRNPKRRRGGGGGEGAGSTIVEQAIECELEGAVGAEPATQLVETAMEEEGYNPGGGGLGEDEEDEPPPLPSKRVRRMYSEWEEDQLKEEMRKRKFKVGGKKMKKEDDRGQRTEEDSLGDKS